MYYFLQLKLKIFKKYKIISMFVKFILLPLELLTWHRIIYHYITLFNVKNNNLIKKEKLHLMDIDIILYFFKVLSFNCKK